MQSQSICPSCQSTFRVGRTCREARAVSSCKPCHRWAAGRVRVPQARTDDLVLVALTHVGRVAAAPTVNTALQEDTASLPGKFFADPNVDGTTGIRLRLASANSPVASSLPLQKLAIESYITVACINRRFADFVNGVADRGKRSVGRTETDQPDRSGWSLTLPPQKGVGFSVQRGTAFNAKVLHPLPELWRPKLRSCVPHSTYLAKDVSRRVDSTELEMAWFSPPRRFLFLQSFPPGRTFSGNRQL